MKLKEFINQISEPGEIWKDILNYETLYMISNHGRFISKEKRVFNGHKDILKPCKLLKPNIYNNRLSIQLIKDNKYKKFSVSQLVAQTFLPYFSPVIYILKHKDGNPLNCYADNLEWIKKVSRKTVFNTENIQDEIWRDIPEFEGFYQISNKGRIKSLSREIKATNRIIKTQDRILNVTPNRMGYLYVTLCKPEKQQRMFIHRIVATVFIPNPENLPYVDHIDTNPLNNCVENLHWVNQTLNMNNPITKKNISNGLKEQYNKSWNCIPIVQLKGNEIVNTFPSISEAHRQGFNKSSVTRCLQGKQRMYKGYTWKYLSNY